MDLGIRGRRALVGGASSGLGRAIADRLAAEGCVVALTARRAAVLRTAADEIGRRHGVAVHAIPGDLSEPGGPATIATAALAALGGIDILVLNAGGPPPVDPTATTPEGWQAALRLLTSGPIDLATRLLPGMRERRWGRIVAVGSYAVRQPLDELAYSTAGRSALVAWLKTVSRVVAADGVTVNGVHPGRHATARIEQLDRLTAERTGQSLEAVRAAHIASIPARRYGEPDEFASYVAYLCSAPAGYLNGTFITVDGGLVAGLP